MGDDINAPSYGKSWRTRVARTRARGKRVTATWKHEKGIGRTRVAQRTTQAPQRVKIPMFNTENLNKKSYKNSK